MGWESKVFNQMLSCSCIFKNTPSWMPPLALLMLFSSYLLLGCGHSSILYTSLAVVFSTVFYTVSKHKSEEVDELEEEKVLKAEEERSSDQIAPTPLNKHGFERVTSTEAEEDAKEEAANYSPDLISQSEFFRDQLLPTSEDSREVDWAIRYGVEDDEWSDKGSISDEESLIEIALPSGHYVSSSLQQRKREISAEALFGHQSRLMDFLSELNIEEDNLIEIDISIGSIKYSRFEIEAYDRSLQLIN